MMVEVKVQAVAMNGEGSANGEGGTNGEGGANGEGGGREKDGGGVEGGKGGEGGRGEGGGDEGSGAAMPTTHSKAKSTVASSHCSASASGLITISPTLSLAPLLGHRERARHRVPSAAAAARAAV